MWWENGVKSREVIIQCCEDLDDLIVGRRRRRFRQGTINRWFWSRPYGQKVSGVEKEAVQSNLHPRVSASDMNLPNTN